MLSSLAISALLGAPEPAPRDTRSHELVGARAQGRGDSVELHVSAVEEGEAILLEQTLLRRLGDRLLEDGYRVVPTGQDASVRIWVHLHGEGARIEVWGQGHRIEEVPGGDPRLVALEIQQLSTALIDAVQPEPAELEPGSDLPVAAVAAVAVELVGEASDPELRERVQAGLLERGFSLTRTPGAGDLRLCMAWPDVKDEVPPQEVPLRLHVVAGAASCEADADVESVVEAPSVDLRRELVFDAGARALRTWASLHPGPEEAAPAQDADPAQAPAELPVAEHTGSKPEQPAADEGVVPEPALDERAQLALSLDARAGLLVRSGGVDPSVGAQLRIGRRRGVGGGLELLVMPSAAAGVRVTEIAPSAAFDWRVPFASRGVVTLGALAGVHFHHYAFEQPSVEGGLRVGPTVAARAGLAYTGARGLLVFGGLRGGWFGGDWAHVDGAELSWRRAPLGLGAHLGVGWDFRVTRGGR